MDIVREVEYQTTVETTAYRRKPVYEIVKRVMDVCCSFSALVILSPVLLITMLAIYIDDPGPVLFKQVRVGRDGRRFLIWKFRSMKKNAEELKSQLVEQNQDHGANFKIENDPRITRIGRFIRKTSIDELPQLFNILKGDMAVIGPRPFIEDEQRKLPSDRLLVKPGLSCYWQIGGKNNLSLSEQIELDSRYIRERSIIVDIKIIVKTVILIFKRENN